MCSGKGEGGICELRGEAPRDLTDGAHVHRTQVDGKTVRDHGPVPGRQTLVLHRALDAPLDLDWLQPCLEQARRGALEQPFEEPLQLGEGAHDRFGSLTEALSRPADGHCAGHHEQRRSAFPPFRLVASRTA